MGCLSATDLQGLINAYRGDSSDANSAAIEKALEDCGENLKYVLETLKENLPKDGTYLEMIQANREVLLAITNKYFLLNEANKSSYEKLQMTNVVFRSWVFLLLLVIFVTLQLAKNPIAKSFSFVSLFFMGVILLSIVYILAPIFFMILLLVIFFISVLTLFYKENYYLSIILLIIEYIAFKIIYKL